MILLWLFQEINYLLHLSFCLMEACNVLKLNSHVCYDVKLLFFYSHIAACASSSTFWCANDGSEYENDEKSV